MGNGSTRVAVIIPGFLSERTIAGCLRSLGQQTFRDFEAIVVDSSPDDRTSVIVESEFPWVQLIRSRERLLPHAARNRGVEASSSEVLVFTDPDIYPRPDWLGAMLEGYKDHGGVIVGAVACANRNWLQKAIHLVKFDMWLPGGKSRPVQISMTGSMLIDRATYLRLGGFDGSRMLADTLFSWCLERHGVSKTIVPEAVVDHDHEAGLGRFVIERFRRGAEHAWLRMSWEGWSVGRTARQLLVTLLPLRLINLTWRGIKGSTHSGTSASWVLALPVILLGQSAWLIGELGAFLGRLRGTAPERDLPCGS